MFGLTPRDFLQVLFFFFFVKPFMALFIGLRVRGYDRIPRQDPFILFANHSSHMDALSLLSLFPLSRLRNIRPAAAADYFEKNRYVSLFAKTFFNILPIARINITASNNPIEDMRAVLSAGQSIIIFPEGTRRLDEELGEFHSGIVHLIKKVPEIPVIPVYLVNMGRTLPKGEFIPLPLFCEIKVGEPHLFSGTKKEILDALKTSVQKLKDIDLLPEFPVDS